MTSSAPDVEAFSIGQLAERTGVAPATLRMWEKRHGFPEASRRVSGHRRYTEADVRAVVDVLRRREAGIRLDVAIEQVRDGGTAVVRAQRAGSPSVYADLRRRHPSLHVHRLRKKIEVGGVRIATVRGLGYCLEKYTDASRSGAGTEQAVEQK